MIDCKKIQNICFLKELKNKIHCSRRKVPLLLGELGLFPKENSLLHKEVMFFTKELFLLHGELA
jgi:hypothetical protein